MNIFNGAVLNVAATAAKLVATKAAYTVDILKVSRIYRGSRIVLHTRAIKWRSLYSKIIFESSDHHIKKAENITFSMISKGGGH